jgi:hypothetical protein
MSTRSVAVQINYPVGTAVIGISNEWDDMTIGRITGYEESMPEIPIVKNFIDGKEYIMFSVLIYFDKEILETLCKLNPYERYNIACRGLVIVRKDKPKLNTGRLLTFEDYVRILDSCEHGDIGKIL